MEGNGLVRSRIRELPGQTQRDIVEALKCGDTFKSEGKDAAAWFILGLFCSITGGIACLYEIDWKETDRILKSGYLYPFIGDQIAAPGLLLCVTAAAVLIRYWVLFCGHYGQILLPDAIGKIRGTRVVLAPFSGIAKIRSSSFNINPKNIGSGRTVHTDEIVMNNGSKITLYNCGLKISHLIERFGEKKS